MKTTLRFTLFCTALIIFQSCDTNIDSSLEDRENLFQGNTEQTRSNIIQENNDGCQQVFSAENKTVPIKLSLIGEYHNELMSTLSRMYYIQNKCEEAEYSIVQGQLDSMINITPRYSEFYLEANTTGMANLYLNELKICEMNGNNQILSIRNLIDSIDHKLVGLVSIYERNFIKGFFNDQLSGNSDSLISYVKIIESNRNLFINEGIYSLAILSIFDNSYCFWSNYSTASQRICFICPIAMDAVGAYYEGMKHAVANNGTGDGFLEDIGRGALEASVPVVGGDIATWFGW